MAAIEDQIRKKYKALCPLMNERMRRYWAGTEADALGKGGIAIVERATGMSRTTIRAGRAELQASGQEIEVGHVRRSGGGRPRLEDRNPGLPVELESLVEPVTRGDLESPLRWTSKSLRKLAEMLTDRGRPISAQKVRQLLSTLGYRITAAKRGLKGPDYDEQFEIINGRVETYQTRSAPVISVEIVKKELVGGPQYGDARGRQGALGKRSGQLASLRDHKLIVPDRDPAISAGIYNSGCNEDEAGVDVDHDTLELAVASISRWWSLMGHKAHDEATELLIVVDSGDDHACRSRLFKTELQKFADRTGLTIGISYVPPGTSKWNKIEHRMLCHVTEDWQGHPPVDRGVVVQLIGATRLATSLCVNPKLHDHIDVTDIETAANPTRAQGVKLSKLSFYDSWNYRISPRIEM